MPLRSSLGLLLLLLLLPDPAAAASSLLPLLPLQQPQPHLQAAACFPPPHLPRLPLLLLD
jgi:hypothetical protein